MAGPTKAELEGALSERVRLLESSLRVFEAVSTVRLDAVEKSAAEGERADADLREKVATLEAKDAAASERARMLEKLSDRSWGLTEKLYVTALSLVCGGLLTLVVQAALRK